jgi:hypothetical protein
LGYLVDALESDEERAVCVWAAPESFPERLKFFLKNMEQLRGVHRGQFGDEGLDSLLEMPLPLADVRAAPVAIAEFLVAHGR